METNNFLNFKLKRFFENLFSKLRGASSLVAQYAHNVPPFGLVGSNPTPATLRLINVIGSIDSFINCVP